MPAIKQALMHGLYRYFKCFPFAGNFNDSAENALCPPVLLYMYLFKTMQIVTINGDGGFEGIMLHKHMYSL